jgi:serine/threonine protein kinase
MVVVAIKRPSHGQGEGKLANEIAVLSAAPRHPCVVGIVGVVVAAEEVGSKWTAVPLRPPLLIMEFMPKGSLHDLLHRSPRPPPWPRHVEIALDVARAVRALHAAEPRVIHRDVKSANILLGRDGRARLADFSLAVRVTAGTRSRDEAGPAPAGTIGYLDPCYTEPGHLGPASDVFSFGVVLLELVSGCKVMDVDASPSSIVSWAAPLIGAGRAREVLDARAAAPPAGSRAERAVARVLAVAARCVSERVERRPAMEEVVAELRGALEEAGWRGALGYARGVVESACRRVVAWGRHVRSRRVMRATKVECSASGGAPEPNKGPCAPPLHSNGTNDVVPREAVPIDQKTQLFVAMERKF